MTHDLLAISVLILSSIVTLLLLIFTRLILPRMLAKRYLESAMAFSRAIELRFPSLTGRSRRVANLCLVIGRNLNLGQNRLLDLEIAAYLRDIGLCAVPYSLLNEKQRHDWSASEQALYNRHPEVSGAMLELVPGFRHLSKIVRNHHVEFSGSEPVSGVLRSQVPKEAYILSVVSDYIHFEAMFGDLLARDKIKQGSGTVYDPAVVDGLFEVILSHSDVEQTADIF